VFALFGRAAFDPVVGANVAPLASMWKALEDRPVPVTTHDIGQFGCGGGVGPGLFQGGEEAGAGRLDGSHEAYTSAHSAMGGSATPTLRAGCLPLTGCMSGN
jgi:hypothetical protein